jgi:hypothetical protein
MPGDASRLRQQLLALERQRAAQLELVVGERGPLLRGSLGVRARVCGNPGCKCMRGERHESKYLSASAGGRTRQVHVPAGEEVAVTAGVERYREFQRRRARLAELAQQQLELVDALGRSLLAPYPPGNPLPPPQRRGRRPQPRMEP